MPAETPKYPLYDSPEILRAFSGRPLAEITDEAARAGQLSMADLRVSAETLRAQAQVARAAGYAGLAGNLARAAELTIVPNGEILAMYAYLRPGRATQEQLLNMAEALEKQYQAVECARLVREAAAVYQQRGLLARSPSK
jgi:propanediol dehydratase small subunit